MTHRQEPPSRRRQALPGIGFALASALVVGWTWWMGRGFGLFSDEWNITVLANQGKLLEPFNGHLSLVPELVYLALSRAIGIDHYGAYRAVALAGYVALAAVSALHAARRTTPATGAVVGVAILWCSAARLTLLFPLLINFTVPAACCVGIWLLLDREQPHDLAGATLLAIALASSAVGVVTALAVGAELLGRRIGRRRAAPYAVPVVLWVAWWIPFHTTTAQPGGLGDLLSFAGHEVLASFAAFSAGWRPGGWLFLAAFVALLAVSAARWRTFDARVVSALSGFVAFVVLTSVGRQGIGSNGLPLPKIEPTTDRYLFVNVVFLLAAAAAMVGPRLGTTQPGVGATRRSAFRRGTTAVGAAVALLLVVVNGRHLARDVDTYRHDQLAYQASTRTFTLGARLAGSAADRRRIIPINFIPVSTGAYLGLLDRVSASPIPADTSGLGSPHDRAQADRWLISDLDLHLAPVGACGSAADAVSTLAAAPGTTVVVAAGPTPVPVSVRRLAGPQQATALGTVPDGQQRVVVLPMGPGTDLPWTISAGAGGRVSRCR